MNHLLFSPKLCPSLRHTDTPITSAGVRMLFNLSSGRLTQQGCLHNPKNRIKFFLRSLLTFPWTLRWLSTIGQTDTLCSLTQKEPSVALRLHRPYLSRGLNLNQRLNLLSQHYQLMLNHLPSDIVQACLSEQGFTLTELEGKSGERYPVRISALHSFDKEGELSLRLYNPLGQVLVTVTFNLIELEQLPAIYIGGLQGPRQSTPHEAIKVATKDLHGLFPKKLAIDALATFVQALGGEQIIATSNQTHIYRSLRYRKTIQADYDSFWETFAGEALESGHYRLALPLPRKALQDVVSKKRGEYQRRYALIDQMSNEITLKMHNKSAIIRTP